MPKSSARFSSITLSAAAGSESGRVLPARALFSFRADRFAGLAHLTAYGWIVSEET